MSRAFLFLALISLMGCTRTASTYRLVSRGPGHVVIPPQVATAEVATRTFNVNIEGRSCTLESAPIRIQPRKTKLRVIVHRDDLLKQPPGWLADWSSQAESQGCIASGSGQALADRIVQSLPLDSTAAYRLLHADSIRSGYVELGPEVRLEIRSPIAEEGTPALDIAKISGTDYKLDVDIKGPSNTIGFELAWYCLERNAGRPGLHFTALSADRNVQGKVEHLSAPAVNHLQFPTEATSFRLFYKGDDNGVRAIVIAGATRQELDRRTKEVASDTSACERSAPMCLLLPARLGINPFLVVSVNGRDITVPLRATVSVVLRAAGVKNPEEVLPALHVTKPFGDRAVPVEFDRKSTAILNLQLMGGERISWQR